MTLRKGAQTSAVRSRRNNTLYHTEGTANRQALNPPCSLVLADQPIVLVSGAKLPRPH